MIEIPARFVYFWYMKFSATRFGGALLLLGSVALIGCLPSGQSVVDEEKEPHFLAGKSRASEMDSKGAIESFEKALEVNPRSASAHFELALLYEKKGTDPAAAIYHYDQYLKLRPGAENADVLVKPHILACKQELVRNVSLSAVSERQQRDFEHLAEENLRLKDELQQLQARYAANPAGQAPVVVRVMQTATPAPSTPVSVAPATPVSSGRTPPGATPANPGRSPRTSEPTASPSVPRTLTATTTASRTHTVKAGETPSIIARKYSVKVDALMAANPRLDARRLRVGQVVTVPPS